MQAGWNDSAGFLYRTLAWQGDPIGQNNLAVLELAQKVSPTKADQNDARVLLRMAADAHLGLAYYNLAIRNIPWDENPKTHKGVTRLLKSAASYGDHHSKELLEAGDGEMDRIRAITNWGDPAAAMDYAFEMHYQQNRSEKIRALRIGTEGGDPAAMSWLAWTLVNYRDRTAEDLAEARELFTAAGEAGDVSAASRLANCYFRAFYFCEKTDMGKAAYWFYKALEKPLGRQRPRISFEADGAIRLGYRSRSYAPPYNVAHHAAENLAVMLVIGLGLNADPDKALEILETHLLEESKDKHLLYNHLRLSDTHTAVEENRLKAMTLDYIDEHPGYRIEELRPYVDGDRMRRYTAVDVKNMQDSEGLELNDEIMAEVLEHLSDGFLVTKDISSSNDLKVPIFATLIVPPGILIPTELEKGGRLVRIPYSEPAHPKQPSLPKAP